MEWWGIQVPGAGKPLWSDKTRVRVNLKTGRTSEWLGGPHNTGSKLSKRGCRRETVTGLDVPGVEDGWEEDWWASKDRATLQPQRPAQDSTFSTHHLRPSDYWTVCTRG